MTELRCSSPATEALRFPIPVPPEPGKTVEIAPGVHWLVTSLPFRLRAINLWLLREGDGWTMIDCGYPLPEVREQIEAAWAGTLDGLPITRLFVTHHHPDHVGNCRWICERWGIVPTITRGERERALKLMGSQWEEESAHRIGFWRRHGLSEAAAANINEHWGRYRHHFRPLPEEWSPIEDGASLPIGGADWQVIVAQGHAQAQALLHSPERNLLISGDQVLPKITPNVSVFGDRPDSQPLGLFLASNRRLAQSCGDVMVLPSHNRPFMGLHARIREIEAHHQERLAKIEAWLQGSPVTAATLLPELFGDGLNGHEIGFAIGEVIAHLHHLVAEGRAATSERNGTILFARREGPGEPRSLG
ncbi:MAG: MBL fold metallo-hydrolase [Candidatus Korobacteraceae bacterium]